MPETNERKFDLEERLLEFSARIIRLGESVVKTEAGRHVALQVIRSGTSPYAQHAEASEAESPADFIHKLKLCLKAIARNLAVVEVNSPGSTG